MKPGKPLPHRIERETFIRLVFEGRVLAESGEAAAQAEHIFFIGKLNENRAAHVEYAEFFAATGGEVYTLRTAVGSFVLVPDQGMAAAFWIRFGGAA